MLIAGVGLAACDATVVRETSEQQTRTFEVEVLRASAGGDCQPVLPDDMESTWITARYTNGSREPIEVRVVDAELVFGLDVPRRSFDVTPGSSGWIGPGETVELEHVNLVGSASGSHVCAACGERAFLTLRFESSAGEEIVREIDAGQVGCVY